MKIYINGRFLTQHPTGVQFFAQELLREIENKIEFEILVPKNQTIVNQSFNQHIKKIGHLKGYLWEQISLPNFIKKQPNCLLINLCNLAPINIKNQIVTIHDLAYIKNKSWFSFAFQKVYNYIIPRIVKNSKSIITVSETVKNEIVNQFLLPEKKVFVVYNKLNEELKNCEPLKPVIEIDKAGFYLMVGSNNPRKNFYFVEHIFNNHFSDKQLIIVGADHPSFSSATIIENNKIIRLKNINSNNLAWLYKNAKALINPSLYEGFGIPNIEAMYFSTPILCSDIPIFHEVCSGYANYFELNNENDFIEKLKSIDIPKQNERLNYFQNQDRVELLKKIIVL